MPSAECGSIYKVRKLGDFVIVYGSGGIAALIPHENTFGLKKLTSLRVVSSAHIAEGEHSHLIYVSNIGELWLIKENQQLERVAQIEPSSEVVLTYNPDDMEFYICGDEKSYILTKDGLCDTPLAISSWAYLDDSLICSGGTIEEDESNPDLSTTDFLVVTDIIDSGMRRMKTLTAVEVGGSCGAGNPFYVAVEYRYDNNSLFTRSPWIRTTKEGAVFPNITAPEMRICIKSSDPTTAYLQYVTCRIKLTDKRYVRGLYATDQINARLDSQ
jgi:hypothetical protein